MKNKYQRYHQQQLDESDCGVICLKTVLKSFGSDLSLEKLENLEGGKFWGKKDYTVSSEDGCTVTTYRKHYAFWIKYDTEPIDVQYIC